MFIEAILGGILLGRLRSGNISALEVIKFKKWKHIVVLILFDLLLRYYIVNATSIMADKLSRLYPFLSTFFYLYTIIVIGFNLNLKYMRIIQSGFMLNFLPIITNGGKMPVSELALASIGKQLEIELLKKDLLLTHIILEDNTRFKVLSDTIAMPYFLPKVISLGDIVLSLGIILFISHYMAMGRKIKSVK